MRALIFGFAALGLAAQEPAAKPLTLAEAEQIALRNHPRVASARIAAQAAKETPKQTLSAYKPQVSVNVTGSLADNGSLSGAGQLSPQGLFSRTAAGLNASMLIWDFGRTRALADSQDARAKALEEGSVAARADILIAVRAAYYRGLVAQIQIRANATNLDTRRVTLKQITALTQSQLRSTLDQSFAELNVAEADVALNRAQADMAAAEVELSAAMGYKDRQRFVLQEVPEPDAAMDSIEELVKSALELRPEIGSLRQQLRASQRFLDSEKKLMMPTLTGAALGGYFGWRDKDLQPRYGSVGVNLSVPLLNGGLFSSRKAEAELRVSAAEQELRDLEIRVSREVRTALVEAENAQVRLALTAKVLEQAQRTLRLAQTRYDLGLGTIVELSQAQGSRVTAEVGAGAARYEYLLRRSLLDYQMGRLR